jgi:hypothetical protein
MRIQNPSKALIALVALICVTVLMALGKIDETGGMGIIGMITGYSVGNGVGAMKRQDTSGMFGPKE